MPDNYLYLGLLAALFPRAKFIHCRRDLRDMAVSCWMTNFRQIRWACDPEHIASRFRAYQRLMEHWRQVLPVPVLEVDYEETVADLEGVARRLVAWCGLEWEPACLAFHEGTSAGAHGQRDAGAPADLHARGGALEALRASPGPAADPVVAPVALPGHRAKLRRHRPGRCRQALSPRPSASPLVLSRIDLVRGVAGHRRVDDDDGRQRHGVVDAPTRRVGGIGSDAGVLECDRPAANVQAAALAETGERIG